MIPSTRPLAVVPLLALVVAFLLPASPALAQDRGQGTQVTGLVGATFSTLRGVDGLDSRTGTLAGVSLLLPLMGPLSFQPEALVVSRGAESGFRTGMELSTFELPLLLRLSITPRSNLTPHLYAGPYLGIEIDCTVDGVSADCEDFPDLNTNTVDVGGILGGGVNLLAGPLLATAGLRYGFGVSTLAEFDPSDAREAARHGAFSIYVGAGFRLGGR